MLQVWWEVEVQRKSQPIALRVSLAGTDLENQTVVTAMNDIDFSKDERGGMPSASNTAFWSCAGQRNMVKRLPPEARFE